MKNAQQKDPNAGIWAKAAQNMSSERRENQNQVEEKTSPPKEKQWAKAAQKINQDRKQEQELKYNIKDLSKAYTQLLSSNVLTNPQSYGSNLDLQDLDKRIELQEYLNQQNNNQNQAENDEQKEVSRLRNQLQLMEIELQKQNEIIQQQQFELKELQPNNPLYKKNKYQNVQLNKQAQEFNPRYDNHSSIPQSNKHEKIELNPLDNNQKYRQNSQGQNQNQSYNMENQQQQQPKSIYQYQINQKQNNNNNFSLPSIQSTKTLRSPEQNQEDKFWNSQLWQNESDGNNNNYQYNLKVKRNQEQQQFQNNNNYKQNIYNQHPLQKQPSQDFPDEAQAYNKMLSQNKQNYNAYQSPNQKLLNLQPVYNNNLGLGSYNNQINRNNIMPNYQNNPNIQSQNPYKYNKYDNQQSSLDHINIRQLPQYDRNQNVIQNINQQHQHFNQQNLIPQNNFQKQQIYRNNSDIMMPSNKYNVNNNYPAQQFNQQQNVLRRF